MAKGQTMAKSLKELAAKANTTNINKKRFLECLRASMGTVTEATKKSKLSRTQHYEWMDTDPAYKSEVEAINESCIDYAESQLFAKMRGIELPDTKVLVVNGKVKKIKMIKKFEPDTTAIIFYLKTKGKRRGYVEKYQVEKTDLEDMLDDDLDKLIEEHERRTKQ